MRPSPSALLLRPWKRYRDGTLFYGLTKTGNKRWALPTKKGNKNYYKGTNSNGVGRITKIQQFIVQWDKVRTYVVPPNLASTNLKPLVDPTVLNVANTYSGYDGPTDPKLYRKKIMEFVEFGEAESPEMLRRENVERG